jgi:hypothetical protein
VTLDRRSRRRCRSPSGSPGRRRAHNLSATRQSQSALGLVREVSTSIFYLKF